MPVESRARLAREIEHGATTTASRQGEFAWGSPAGKIRHDRRARFLVSGLPRTSTILEIGAGTGFQTTALLAAFDRVVGIDISPDLLAIAKQRAPRASYYVMDAHRPAFSAQSFDAVVGVSVLHHLDWDRALANYHPLLRPGGVIRFSEPNLLNPQIFFQKNISYLKRLAGDTPDEYAFTRWRIASSLRTAGFDEISVRPFEFLHPATPGPLIPCVKAVESVISRTPLVEIAGSLLIQARKPPR
jgi:SAM-dependent methyltransferase